MEDFENYEEKTEETVSAEEPVENETSVIPDESVKTEQHVISETTFQEQPNENPFLRTNAAYSEMISYNTKPKKPGKNIGLRIFSLILAFAVVLTAGCYIGFVSGQNSIKKSTFSSVELASKPLGEDALNTAQIYERLNPSVVGIKVYNTSGEGASATGVVYSDDGYIITNDHIYSSVSNAKFKVTDFSGKEYNAEFIAGDTRSDIAVLKCFDCELKPAVFGNSDEVVIGESVCTVGKPDAVEENCLTCGIISLTSRRIQINTSYNMNLIQTDAAINPGNSGGALVNVFGQVIGITSSKISSPSYEGVGFAVPTSIACRVADSLIKTGTVDFRGKLAISYNEVSSISAEISGLPVVGVYIAEIDENSDLYGKAEVGDIITSVNGVEITNDNILLDVIENGTVGDELTLEIYTQDGKRKTVTAKTIPDPGNSSYIVD